MKRSVYLILLTLALALALPAITDAFDVRASDWAMFRRDPQHTGTNNEEASITPPLEAKWIFSPPNVISSVSNSPVVVNKTVYYKHYSTLTAIDASTGTLKWSRFEGTVDHGSPAIANGIIYEGNPCIDCSLRAIDTTTGNDIWSISLPRGVRSPVVSDGIVYFGSDDWYVRAANAVTGQIIWTSPKLSDGVTAAPVVANGKVVVGTWSGYIHALDANTGQAVWSFPGGGVMFSSPSVENGILYIGSGYEWVYAIDINTGQQIWRFNGAHDSVWGSPAIYDGKLYIQDLAGYIYALKIQDGSVLWTYKTGAVPSSSYSSAAVANGVVYIGSQDKYLYAFDAYTGEVVWKYLTGGPVISSPAIADGMVFVGSNDGKLYAFGMPGENLPSLNVPDLKQYSPPWGDDKYDHASTWATNPTITRWGCALTSASMILKYFGHTNANPDILNNWLIENRDGYLRNGLLNWLAVSRYTREHDSEGSPTLLYRNLAPTNNNLISELTAGNPAILKEPGHFIVAKSQTPDSFGINDPASETKPTLASYGNSFASLGVYRPTHTDLSYILLAINPELALKVFDPEGNEIIGFTSLEEPITDDLGELPSNSGLVVFQYPTPVQGIYRVEVSSGNGWYQLDSYLYDAQGNPAIKSFTQIITPGQTDTYKITIGPSNETEENITIDTIIQDLDAGWQNGLITKRTLYEQMRRQLLSAKSRIVYDKPDFAKRDLEQVLREINIYTPRFIDRAFSRFLSNNIQLILSSLVLR